MVVAAPQLLTGVLACVLVKINIKKSDLDLDKSPESYELELIKRKNAECICIKMITSFGTFDFHKIPTTKRVSTFVGRRLNGQRSLSDVIKAFLDHIWNRCELGMGLGLGLGGSHLHRTESNIAKHSNTQLLVQR